MANSNHWPGAQGWNGYIQDPSGFLGVFFPMFVVVQVLTVQWSETFALSVRNISLISKQFLAILCIIVLDSCIANRRSAWCMKYTTFFTSVMRWFTILAFESLAGITCENSGLSSLHAVLAARVETPLSGENRGETAVFAGYSLNPTMVLPLNETPLGEVKQRTI